MPVSAHAAAGVIVPASDGLNTSRGSARRTVSYRDARGVTMNALVIAPGSGSGLKLRVTSRFKTNQVVDNVPVATGLKQTNVYFNRLQ